MSVWQENRPKQPITVTACGPTTPEIPQTVCYAHSATPILKNNKPRILLLGGNMKGVDKKFIQAFLYNPTTNRAEKVEPTGTTPSQRWGHAVCTFPQEIDGPHDRLMLTAGFDNQSNFNDVWVYDIPKNEWTSPAVRGIHYGAYHSTVYHEGTASIYFFGGMCCVGGPYQYNNDVLAVQLPLPKAKSPALPIHTKGDAPKPRAQHSAALWNDCMVISGGYTGDSVLNDTWVLDLVSQTWREVNCAGTPPVAMSGMTPAPFRIFSCRRDAVCIANYLYLICGCAPVKQKKKKSAAAGDDPMEVEPAPAEEEENQQPVMGLFRLDLNKEVWEKLSLSSVYGPVRQYALSPGDKDDPSELFVFGGNAYAQRTKTIPLLKLALGPWPVEWAVAKLFFLAHRMWESQPKGCFVRVLPNDVVLVILSFLRNNCVLPPRPGRL
eukprot:TRINITY_DN29015_c0_g1_i1.p2 TRINITY_DN29015_c0_g1~~TRINITY_DN29015_c0_g1_i1.p2  ORF type:complete len:436 (+),score=43.26 TRINITY_DN29015_c0_g1_i1:52-1359(+)